MPFRFQWLCELLEELEANRHKHVLTTARVQNHEHQIIDCWYQRFNHKIERTGPSAIAFLSCLFPEHRPDRVYNLQQKRLSHIVGRALGLGTTRAAELNLWSARDGSDFATCVEQVLLQCENEAPTMGREVTLEEIDSTLNQIAARSPSSSPAIRCQARGATVTDLLTPILCRLRSCEAKWFTRMLLKRYWPVQIPEYEALHGFHFMLPNLVRIQSSFEAAVAVLSKEAIRHLPARPEKNYEVALQTLVSEHVQPQIGVMVKRQPYHKARSIRSCCELASRRQMSVERKYDGEYCQIHVDMSKKDYIQIFSKSGKDSTSDRFHLHNAIKDALRLDGNGCRIKHNCIVEGELLVWNMTTRRILPFHKIRKYVKHGGRHIGTANDSPTKRDEHLMIAFYDILLLDNQLLLNKPHNTRRQHLKAVLHTMKGTAILGERTIIDFGSSRASQKLREIFSKAITQRWEGLVLKGSDDPYFLWGRPHHGIKLKKDYISKLGDTADLCIVGGRRDAREETEIRLGPLRWTCFHVGAVCNLDAVRRFGEKPLIKVIDVLTHHSMPSVDLLDLNRLGRLAEIAYCPNIAQFDVEIGCANIRPPTELFTVPFIVEIMGAGYEKLYNSSFFTLRFPRKIDGRVKLHTDRTLLDTTSFADLQSMAERSLHVNEDTDVDEDAEWIKRLTKADGKKRQSQNTSQATSSAKTPASASAISLSPIGPRRKGSSHVYVRPDTEEPETQAADHHSDSVTNRGGALGGVPKDQSSTASTIVEGCSETGCKRPLGGSLARCNNERELKRQRVNMMAPETTRSTPLPMSPDNARFPVSVHEEIGVTGACAVSLVTRSLGALRPSAFNPLTEFYTPKKSKGYMDSSQSQSANSLPTPDSIKLMREVMNAHYMQELDEPHAFIQNSTVSSTKHQDLGYVPSSEPSDDDPMDSAPSSLAVLHPSLIQDKHHTDNVGECSAQTTRGAGAQAEPPASTRDSGALASSNSNSTQSRLVTTDSTNVPSSSTVLSVILLGPAAELSAASATRRSIEASFTYSCRYFLNHMDQINHSKDARNSFGFILIDPANTDSTVDLLENLAHEIEARSIASKPQHHDSQKVVSKNHILHHDDQNPLQSCLTSLNGRILVFDHTVIKKTKSMSVDTGGFNIDVLRSLDFDNGHGKDAALFYGIVQFTLGARPKRRKSRVRDGRRDNPFHESAHLRVKIGLEYTFDWLEN